MRQVCYNEFSYKEKITLCYGQVFFLYHFCDYEKNGFFLSLELYSCGFCCIKESMMCLYCFSLCYHIMHKYWYSFLAQSIILELSLGHSQCFHSFIVKQVFVHKWSKHSLWRLDWNILVYGNIFLEHDECGNECLDNLSHSWLCFLKIFYFM